MIERDDRLSISRQAQRLGLSLGGVSYLLRPASQTDLALMRRIDALHLDDPFAGSRMLQGLPKAESYEVGQRRVSTLMQRMGIEALYRCPKTSKPAPGHKIYPSLLRGLLSMGPSAAFAERIERLATIIHRMVEEATMGADRLQASRPKEA